MGQRRLLSLPDTYSPHEAQKWASAGKSPLAVYLPGLAFLPCSNIPDAIDRNGPVALFQTPTSLPTSPELLTGHSFYSLYSGANPLTSVAGAHCRHLPGFAPVCARSSAEQRSAANTAPSHSSGPSVLAIARAAPGVLRRLALGHRRPVPSRRPGVDRCNPLASVKRHQNTDSSWFF